MPASKTPSNDPSVAEADVSRGKTASPTTDQPPHVTSAESMPSGGAKLFIRTHA